MANVVSQQIPSWIVWPSFISYILVVAYSMTSLITGVISESLLMARLQEETLRLADLEENRKTLLEGLQKALGALDEDGSGTLTHNEVARAIEHHHEIVPRLEALDVKIEDDDLVKLFDKMAKLGGSNNIRIDDFIEFLRCHTGTARAAALFDAKHDVIHAGKEVNRRQSREIEDLREDVNQLYTCMADVNNKLNWLLGDAADQPCIRSEILAPTPMPEHIQARNLSRLQYEKGAASPRSSVTEVDPESPSSRPSRRLRSARSLSSSRRKAPW
eukprot:gnl/TRDRNA2_/TRDRNA2_173911_c0_seq2.p1 gnl/TRDRNA2_/TRDRNA2_173911_c0~~gnl/TRDRNA2_/TRDRNA2_173911_c0_seq2.p1  ORF type:complete len:319 (-),score=48.41 gnl/TRDRNA2_/TRDRNA2_173911_c0_seq2:251-1069(-)